LFDNLVVAYFWGHSVYIEASLDVYMYRCIQCGRYGSGVALAMHHRFHGVSTYTFSKAAGPMTMASTASSLAKLQK